MLLHEKIMHIYPNIVIQDFYINGTIELQDLGDGKGSFIGVWNRPESQPTQEQLDSLD